MDRKPTIPEVLPLIRAYYAKPGNSVGGAFHIMLEDGNWEQGHADWCLQEARERGDPDGIALGEILVRMSGTQRRKLASMSHYPWASTATL